MVNTEKKWDERERCKSENKFWDLVFRKVIDDISWRISCESLEKDSKLLLKVKEKNKSSLSKEHFFVTKYMAENGGQNRVNVLPLSLAKHNKHNNQLWEMVNVSWLTWCVLKIPT